MIKKILLILGLGAFMLALVCLPEQFAEAVSNGVELCLRSVVPSLFLFLCACALIRRLRLLGRVRQKSGPIFAFLHLPANILPCLVLGAVCGFPVGAKEVCAAKQEGVLTTRQAAFALSLCAGASPAFMGAFIGVRIFGSAATGLGIWGISLLVSLLVNAGICRYFLNGQPTASRSYAIDKMPPLFPTLIAAIKEAASTLFSVCALIVFFSSVTGVLSGVLAGLTQPLAALLFGLIEMTSGLALLHLPTPLTAALCAGLSTFGGLSITAQTMLFARQARVPLRPYLLSRLVTGVLAAGVTFLVFSRQIGT